MQYTLEPTGFCDQIFFFPLLNLSVTMPWAQRAHIGFSPLDFVQCLSDLYNHTVCVCMSLSVIFWEEAKKKKKRKKKKQSIHFLNCYFLNYFQFWGLDKKEVTWILSSEWKVSVKTHVKYVCFILWIYLSCLSKMNYRFCDQYYICDHVFECI